MESKPELTGANVLDYVTTQWNDRYMELHNKYPLRYGHCRVCAMPKGASFEDFERKSMVSILFTESAVRTGKKDEDSPMRFFFEEFKIDDKRKALESTLLLLKLYESSNVDKIDLNGLESFWQGLELDNADIDIHKIPERVVEYLLISSNDQGNPDADDSNDLFLPFREPAKGIVVSFLEATMMRTFETFSDWMATPYEIEKYELKNKEIVGNKEKEE